MVPAREQVSDYTIHPSTLSSIEPAEPAAVTAAVGQAQQRPPAPTLTFCRDTVEARNPKLADTGETENPRLGVLET